MRSSVAEELSLCSAGSCYMSNANTPTSLRLSWPRRHHHHRRAVTCSDRLRTCFPVVFSACMTHKNAVMYIHEVGAAASSAGRQGSVIKAQFIFCFGILPEASWIKWRNLSFPLTLTTPLLLTTTGATGFLKIQKSSQRSSLVMSPLSVWWHFLLWVEYTVFCAAAWYGDVMVHFFLRPAPAAKKLSGALLITIFHTD